MSREIVELKEYLEDFVAANPRISRVASKRASSGRVHLSVYLTSGAKPLGIEFGPVTMQNLWLRTQDAPTSIPAGVKVTRKNWTGQTWASPDGDGANSNLDGYDDFHGHDLIRLGMKTRADAQHILNHLLK